MCNVQKLTAAEKQKRARDFRGFCQTTLQIASLALDGQQQLAVGGIKMIYKNKLQLMGVLEF